MLVFGVLRSREPFFPEFSLNKTNATIIQTKETTFSMKIRTLGSLPLLISTLTLSASAAIDSSSFAPRLELPVDGGATLFPNVVIGDLDGDGKLDIVAINGPANKFVVFRNASTGASLSAGSFAPRLDFATPTGPTMVDPGGLAIGDLDGDGKLDLVIVESYGGRLFIFRNTSTVGSISFAPAVILQYGLATSGNPGVVIRDMDGDGKPDIITSRIAVLRNTSTPGVIDASSFAPAYIFELFNNPWSLAVDDLDGDGKPDVVVGSRSDGAIFVLRNSSTIGNIALDLQAVLTVGCCLESVAIADLNGDGKLDIAAAKLYNGPANLSIFQNNSTPGDLTASAFAQVAFEKGDFSRIAIADLDGDGKPDIIGANDTDGGGGSLLSVLRNVIPTGSPITSSAFAPRVSFLGGSGSVAIGDLDGDGKLDLVGGDFGGHWIAIYQNTTGDSVAPTITCPANIVQGTDSGQCSAVVQYTVTATDDSGSTTVVSTPPSGSVFPKGTTTVNSTATDGSGNQSVCSFTVTVNDNEKPSITCPANVSLGCSPDLLTPVTFSATAHDNCDPNPTITYSKAPGSGFPVGTTTVNCTATDASANQSSASFTVTRAPLAFTGFLDPIGGADATGGSFATPVRTIKLKSTLPVKFTAACNGSPVLAGIHRLQVLKYADQTTSGDPIDATPTDAATTGDQFQLAGTEWHFNLDTKATCMSVGTWLLRATLSDGSQHSAWIQIK